MAVMEEIRSRLAFPSVSIQTSAIGRLESLISDTAAIDSASQLTPELQLLLDSCGHEDVAVVSECCDVLLRRVRCGQWSAQIVTQRLLSILSSARCTWIITGSILSLLVESKENNFWSALNSSSKSNSGHGSHPLVSAFRYSPSARVAVVHALRHLLSMVHSSAATTHTQQQRLWSIAEPVVHFILYDNVGFEYRERLVEILVESALESMQADMDDVVPSEKSVNGVPSHENGKQQQREGSSYVCYVVKLLIDWLCSRNMSRFESSMSALQCYRRVRKLVWLSVFATAIEESYKLSMYHIAAAWLLDMAAANNQPLDVMLKEIESIDASATTAVVFVPSLYLVLAHQPTLFATIVLNLLLKFLPFMSSAADQSLGALPLYCTNITTTTITSSTPSSSAAALLLECQTAIQNSLVLAGGSHSNTTAGGGAAHSLNGADTTAAESVQVPFVSSLAQYIRSAARLPLLFQREPELCKLWLDHTKSELKKINPQAALDTPSLYKFSMVAMVVSSVLVSGWSCRELRLASVLAMQSLAVACPPLSHDLLKMLLHCFNVSTMEADVQLAILHALPEMVTHNVMLSPVVATITGLMAQASLQPLSLRLVCKIWQKMDRLFPQLLKVLTVCAEHMTSSSEMLMSCSATVLDIAQTRSSQHASDVMPIIRRLLSAPVRLDVRGEVIAMATRSLHLMILNEVVEFKAVWTTLGQELSMQTRELAQAAVCRLMGSMAELQGEQLPSRQDEALYHELISSLFRMIFSQPASSTTVISAAYEALSCFPVECFQASMLPPAHIQALLDTGLLKPASSQDAAAAHDSTVSSTQACSNGSGCKTASNGAASPWPAPPSQDQFGAQPIPADALSALMVCNVGATDGHAKFLAHLLQHELKTQSRGPASNDRCRPTNNNNISTVKCADARLVRVLGNVPKSLLKLYESCKSPASLPSLAAGLLSCHQPSSIASKASRNATTDRHLILLQNLLSQIAPPAPNAGTMDILGLAEKWCAFLRRLFAHLIHVNHTDEESLVNKLQAFSGARDKIFDVLQKASRLGTNSLFNSTLALTQLYRVTCDFCNTDLPVSIYPRLRSWKAKMIATMMNMASDKVMCAGGVFANEQIFSWGTQGQVSKGKHGALCLSALFLGVTSLCHTLVGRDWPVLKMITDTLSQHCAKLPGAGTHQMIAALDYGDNRLLHLVLPFSMGTLFSAMVTTRVWVVEGVRGMKLFEEAREQYLSAFAAHRDGATLVAGQVVTDLLKNTQNKELTFDKGLTICSMLLSRAEGLFDAEKSKTELSRFAKEASLYSWSVCYAYLVSHALDKLTERDQMLANTLLVADSGAITSPLVSKSRMLCLMALSLLGEKTSQSVLSNTYDQLKDTLRSAGNLSAGSGLLQSWECQVASMQVLLGENHLMWREEKKLHIKACPVPAYDLVKGLDTARHSADTSFSSIAVQAVGEVWYQLYEENSLQALHNPDEESMAVRSKSNVQSVLQQIVAQLSALTSQVTIPTRTGDGVVNTMLWPCIHTLLRSLCQAVEIPPTFEWSSVMIKLLRMSSAPGDVHSECLTILLKSYAKEYDSTMLVNLITDGTFLKFSLDNQKLLLSRLYSGKLPSVELKCLCASLGELFADREKHQCAAFLPEAIANVWSSCRDHTDHGEIVWEDLLCPVVTQWINSNESKVLSDLIYLSPSLMRAYSQEAARKANHHQSEVLTLRMFAFRMLEAMHSANGVGPLLMAVETVVDNCPDDQIVDMIMLLSSLACHRQTSAFSTSLLQVLERLSSSKRSTTHLIADMIISCCSSLLQAVNSGNTITATLTSSSSSSSGKTSSPASNLHPDHPDHQQQQQQQQPPLDSLLHNMLLASGGDEQFLLSASRLDQHATRFWLADWFMRTGCECLPSSLTSLAAVPAMSVFLKALGHVLGALETAVSELNRDAICLSSLRDCRRVLAANIPSNT
ncbi:uncharacterized protein LOC135812951 [Sycon ciliatum]|uniref:uncharacterized protein LOC135812951 n=1 Tax=Sycon ciliatum TaxID=27933 RepID=UPI0031F6A911